MKQPDSQDIKAVIAQARRLVDKARETVAEGERLCAEHGLDPEQCLAEIRRTGGEAAVQKAQNEVAEALRAIEDEIERNRVTGKAKPIGRRVALRSARI